MNNESKMEYQSSASKKWLMTPRQFLGQKMTTTKNPYPMLDAQGQPVWNSFMNTSKEAMNITLLDRGKACVPEEAKLWRSFASTLWQDVTEGVPTFYCIAIHKRPEKVRKICGEFDYRTKGAPETKENIRAHMAEVVGVVAQFHPGSKFRLLWSVSAAREEENHFFKSGVHWVIKFDADTDDKQYGADVSRLEWIAATNTKVLSETFPRDGQDKNPWCGFLEHGINDYHCIYNGLRLNHCWKASECRDCNNHALRRPTCIACESKGYTVQRRWYELAGVITQDGVDDTERLKWYHDNPVDMLIDTSIVALSGALEPNWTIPNGSVQLIRPSLATQKSGKPAKPKGTDAWPEVKDAKVVEKVQNVMRSINVGSLRPYSDLIITSLNKSPEHPQYGSFTYSMRTNCRYCLNKSDVHSSQTVRFTMSASPDGRKVKVVQRCNSYHVHGPLNKKVQCLKFVSEPILWATDEVTSLFPFKTKRVSGAKRTYDTMSSSSAMMPTSTTAMTSVASMVPNSLADMNPYKKQRTMQALASEYDRLEEQRAKQNKVFSRPRAFPMPQFESSRVSKTTVKPALVVDPNTGEMRVTVTKC